MVFNLAPVGLWVGLWTVSFAIILPSSFDSSKIEEYEGTHCPVVNSEQIFVENDSIYIFNVLRILNFGQYFEV